MRTITCQVVVKVNDRVLFKTEPTPAYNCKEIFEELEDKFRMSKYSVKIIKKTVYSGYAELKNVTKEDDNPPF